MTLDHLASVVTLLGFPLILFGLIDLYRERKLSLWRARKWVGIGLLILGSAAWGADVADRLGFVQLSTLGFPANTGPIVWNFDETAHGRGYFLDMQKTADAQAANIVGFGAVGKNVTPDPIDDFVGYIRSDVTNEKIPIYFMAADSGAAHACVISVPTPPEETLGIPAFSLFAIATHKKPVFVNVPYADAMPAAKFKSEFVPFTVVMKYAGKEYKRRFSREEVDLQLATFEKATAPPTNPYVVRKNATEPTSLPPLTPLIKRNDISTPANPDLTGTVLQK